MTADSPQFKGISERAPGLIRTTTMADRIQASELSTGARLPATASSWAEAPHWVCHALNCAATTADPERMSPHDVWHGSTSTVP